jgi:hypothetical protein
MGQVPRANPWLLVGDGRLARHLTFYFSELGIAHGHWSRRQGWIGTRPTAPWPIAITGFDRVLLAIRDDALSAFVSKCRTSASQPWIHFSGSRVIDGAWSAHPLCTFGPELYEPGLYSTVPFVIEQTGPGFDSLLPGLPNRSAAIPAEDKALYHALCVAAGNFTTLLWQRFFAEIRDRWQLEADWGWPYLERTARNLQSSDSAAALTGPLARRDANTIEQNLHALESAGLNDLARLYSVFADMQSGVVAGGAA